jgi:chitodextrinase
LTQASTAVLPSLCTQVPIKAINKSIFKTKRKKKKKTEIAWETETFVYLHRIEKKEKEGKRELTPQALNLS